MVQLTINLTRGNLELNFPRPKGSENYDAPKLPLVKFIVNCTRNHAITSTNFVQETGELELISTIFLRLEWVLNTRLN